MAWAGQNLGRDRGDVAGRYEPDLAAARGRGNHALLADVVTGVQEIFHIQAGGEVGDRKAERVQVHGDLAVAAHEAHLAVGILEAVRGDLDDVRAVAGGRKRVDE